jgi:hypothetical protein
LLHPGGGRLAGQASALDCQPCGALTNCNPACVQPPIGRFHMGIAASTLFTLPRSLRLVARWIHERIRYHRTSAPRCAATLRRLAGSAAGSSRPGAFSQPLRDPLRTGPASARPLPANAPCRRLQPSPLSESLSTQCTGAYMGQGLMACPAQGPASSDQKVQWSRTPSAKAPSERPPPPPVRRRFDAISGRFVIAGRMADVCAELDRLAAAEAASPRHNTPSPKATCFVESMSSLA